MRNTSAPSALDLNVPLLDEEFDHFGVAESLAGLSSRKAARHSQRSIRRQRDLLDMFS